MLRQQKHLAEAGKKYPEIWKKKTDR